MRRRIGVLLAAASLPWILLAGAGKSKNPKEDPEAIGERDVSKGVNLYSLEKEIALGRQL